ncbi:MAG: hypothetical protein ACRBN8_30570 [Nannocystales bacterium]
MPAHTVKAGETIQTIRRGKSSPGAQRALELRGRVEVSPPIEFATGGRLLVNPPSAA